MKLRNRNVIVIQRKRESAPIVIGPFQHRGNAVTRCDEIDAHLEEVLGITSGTEYEIDVVNCDSVTTSLVDIERMMED